jgi:hypothetical protein
MQRRFFLQRAGLVLAASSVSDFGLAIISQRYQRAMAGPTDRKLALLIGINQYSDRPLNGCLTDVAMQRELLIHRLGFAPSDILTLVNEQATQAQIVTAFAEHLQQAQAGDIVVVHFSGYSRLVQLGTTQQPSLLTADTAAEDSVVGLSADTLALLVRSLPTKQVTTILDTGAVYSGTPLQGNLRIRARPSLMVEQLATAEVALQDRLLAQLPRDRMQLTNPPGVVLAAAGADQLALEAQWHGFSAGLFTYALTQQLWQTLPPITLKVCLSQAAATIAQLAAPDQVPNLISADDRDRPPYDTPLLAAPAEGVITAIEDNGKVATVWLGGLAANVLELAGSNSSFMLANSAVALAVIAREGLMAKVRLPADFAIAVGQLVQEAGRTIPRQVSLAVALDPTLERIERIDATSAFDGLPRVDLVAAGAAADYLFGKLPQAATQVAALPTFSLAGLIPPSSYGLFSQGKSPIANTTGEPGEAIKLAVRRLVPQLQTLLATKLLNLTVNDHASRLEVRATMALATPTQLLMQQETGRVADRGPKTISAAVPVGSQVQYQIQNLGDQPLYFVVLGLDSNGKTFYYAQAVALPPRVLQDVIAPNLTVTLPPIGSPTEWIVRSPIGQAETYLICSRTPLIQTQTLLAPTSPVPAFQPLPNPLEVAQAILQDLDQGNTPDAFTLDVNHWATLRFVYQVV